MDSRWREARCSGVDAFWPPAWATGKSVSARTSIPGSRLMGSSFLSRILNDGERFTAKSAKDAKNASAKESRIQSSSRRDFHSLDLAGVRAGEFLRVRERQGKRRLGGMEANVFFAGCTIAAAPGC